MITDEAMERVRGWFSGRLPDEWQSYIQINADYYKQAG